MVLVGDVSWVSCILLFCVEYSWMTLIYTIQYTIHIHVYIHIDHVYVWLIKVSYIDFSYWRMLSLQEIMAELAGSGNGWKTPCQAKNVQGGSAPRTQDAMMGKACVLTTSGPLRGMNGWMMDDGWWDYDEIMLSHDLLRLSAMFFFYDRDRMGNGNFHRSHQWRALVHTQAGWVSVEGCD